MKTEADVAAHLGVSACIIYAQSFSTVSSVIPSFSKRGDIIVADKAVNFAVRKGIQISRSTVRWYEHNDMEDLENVLKKVVKEQAKKPLTRRFIITEGLFENIGDVVNLPKIVRGHPSIQKSGDANKLLRLSSNSNTSSASSSTNPGPTAS
jgi:serine palmitoyltransferase